MTILNYALSDSTGEAELHISKRSDSSSLLPIGEGQTTAYPGTEEATTEVIALETLDNLMTEPPAGPVLLKIDVQGAELSVLRGAEKTWQRSTRSSSSARSSSSTRARRWPTK